MQKKLKKFTAVCMAAFLVAGLVLTAPAQTVLAESYTETPQELVFGETYTGAIYSTQDKYRYDFTVEEAGTVEISGTLNGQYLILNLYNESGDRLSNELVNSFSFSYSVSLNKGNYYVVADGSMGTVGTTTFELTAAYTKLPEASLKKLTRKAAGGSLKVKWTKRTAVSGYQIQYATNEKLTKGKKSCTVEGAAVNSTKLTELKKSKTYYVRIRTYLKTADGSVAYSAWSSVKKA